MQSGCNDPRSPDFYDESYYRHAIHGRHWFRDNERKHRARLVAVSEALAATRSDRLLDLGCADGRHTALLAPMVAHAIGIDFSQAAILIAKSRCEDAPGLEFIRADASMLDMIAASSIDKVTAIDFFEHIDDLLLVRVLSEAWRVLKPGGRLIFYTPCSSHYVERLKASGIVLKQIPGHIAVRDGPAYRKLAGALPWRSIDLRYLPSEYPLFGLLDRVTMRIPWLGSLFRFRVVGILVKP